MKRTLREVIFRHSQVHEESRRKPKITGRRKSGVGDDIETYRAKCQQHLRSPVNKVRIQEKERWIRKRQTAMTSANPERNSSRLLVITSGCTHHPSDDYGGP